MRAILPLVFVTIAGCAPAAPADSPAFSSLSSGDALSPTGPFAVTGAYPIVLHHGFNASPDSDWGWHDRVKTVLEGLGHHVFISQVNPYSTPPLRAAELEGFVEDVLRQTGASQVHIIAHSQGGLDARFLVSPDALGRADMVATLTTISTPHHGTYIADVAGGFAQGLDATLDSKAATDALAGVMSKNLNARAHAYDFNLAGALESMAESRIEAEFNDVFSDAPSVYYQSLAGVSNVAGAVNSKDLAECQVDPADELAAGTLRRLNDRLRDSMTRTLDPVAAFVAHGYQILSNDGVVRVSSSRWGRFRGCILADHMGVVGQGNDAGLVDHLTGFDIFAFYAQLAAELVQQNQGW